MACGHFAEYLVLWNGIWYINLLKNLNIETQFSLMKKSSVVPKPNKARLYFAIPIRLFLHPNYNNIPDASTPKPNPIGYTDKNRIYLKGSIVGASPIFKKSRTAQST